MAKAFLKAKEIASIAISEIVRLQKEQADKIEAAIVALVGEPVLRGHLWWKSTHLRTRAEAEDIFNGTAKRHYFSEAYYVRLEYRYRLGKLKTIREAALGAIERGDATVLLDHEEIAVIRAVLTH